MVAHRLGIVTSLVLLGGAAAAGDAASIQVAPARFLTRQATGQWLASRAIGTTVVSASNETVGDVSDVVIDPDGRAVALVIGVGGFLGLGEKTVAVPLDRIELQPLQVGASTPESGRRAPDRVVLKATRGELQMAPEFHPAPRPLPSLPRFDPSHH